jgi:hypothetical protein
MTAMQAEDAQREAMERVLDSERLLEGEDPDTVHLDDAQHWLHVYRELLGFKDHVVGEAASSAADLPADAEPEAEADLTILETERRRLKRRYRFWQARVGQLSST